MAVPTFQSLMRPLLEATVASGEETSIRALGPSIADRLKLTPDDLAELFPSGRQSKFLNRLHWAKTFMERAQLIAPTRRGYFKATERAGPLLGSVGGPLSMKVLERFPEYVLWRASSTSEAHGVGVRTRRTYQLKSIDEDYFSASV